ncbi:transforming growth factor-beta-induced protein ig-h3, partial [Biomphalaria glabrata]
MYSHVNLARKCVCVCVCVCVCPYCLMSLDVSTSEKPLDNIIGTARELKLNKFIALAEKARLTTDLMQYGPYTAFVPSDEAIADAAPALVSSLSDTKGGSPLIRYHIAPGRLNISNFKERDQELVTLHDGSRVRVNKYAYG